MGDSRWSKCVFGLVSAVVLAGTVVATGCSSDEGDEVGVVRVAITNVPADVLCIRITASGTSRMVARSFDVMPGQGSVLMVTGVPTGQVQFAGDAFGTACAAVGGGSAATWSSDPVTAQVTPGTVASVSLVMHRNGSVSVSVDFQDDGQMCGAPGTPCSPGMTVCCAGLACDPATKLCLPPLMCVPNGQACDPTQPVKCCSGQPCTGVCGAPTCSDMIKDGTETDIDCGGPSCPACSPGRACLASSDCLPGLACLGNICQPAVCAPTGVPCNPNMPCCSGQACPIPGMLCGSACMPSGTPCQGSTPCCSGICVNVGGMAVCQ
jgi:hypothetical protein